MKFLIFLLLAATLSSRQLLKFFSFLVFFLFATSLFATVNEPLRIEVFSGYRNDRIHWHLKTPGEDNSLTYTELARNVQFWTNGLVLKAIHRDLTFYIRGSYGAFGKGTLYQRYYNLPFTSESPQYQFNTDGWAADAAGYVGYAVNLTADRTYKVVLIPLIGYSGYWEQLSRNNGEAQSPVLSGFNSSLPSIFKLVWNGFFLGANFLIEPGGRLVLNAGYSYNIMHNRMHTQLESGFDGDVVRQTVKTNAEGNPGQSGWMQVDCLLPRLWRIGLGADIHYFSSRVINASITDVEDQNLKLRWTSISGWLQISREI